MKISVKKIISKIFEPYFNSKELNKLNEFKLQYEKFTLPNCDFTKVSFSDYNIFKEFSKLSINENSVQEILEHNFNILGSGLICVNKTNEIGQESSNRYHQIDWNKDFKSGFAWSNQIPANEIKIGFDYGVDIKVPWELARMHQLPCLAFAVNKSIKFENDKLILEIQNQIRDFIENNPPFFGVNWISPMEVSIRAINLIFTISILHEKEIILPDEILIKLSNYLFLSGIFIHSRREWSSGMRNNHYFSNIIGLLLISSIFPTYDLMQEINKFAEKEYFQEIEFQFNEDGSNFEGSLPYHFFMLEMIYLGLEVLKPKLIKKIKTNQSFLDKISKILDFSKNIRGTKNYFPQIGDNDGGKILNFNKLLNINDNYFYSEKVINSLYDLLSYYYSINFKYLYSSKTNKINLYKDIGIITYQNKSFKIWISLGRNAQNGKGGHNHNDSFSFVLQVDDKEILTDPGTYVYTSFPKERNKFRSSKSHNTIDLSKFENIIYLKPEDLFWFSDKKCSYEILEENDSITIKLKKKIRSEFFHRTFIINNETIEIIDKIPDKYTDLEMNLHFSPNIQDFNVKSNSILEIENILSIESSILFEFEEYNFSPDYGKLEIAKKIRIGKLSKSHSTKIRLNSKKLN